MTRGLLLGAAVLLGTQILLVVAAVIWYRKTADSRRRLRHQGYTVSDRKP